MTKREKILLGLLIFVSLSSGVVAVAANPAVGANGIDFTRLASDVCPSGAHTCVRADNSANLLEKRSDHTGYIVAASPAPSAGQCIVYNSGGMWTPGTCGGGMTIGDPVAGASANSILFVDGSGDLAQENSDFYYDGDLHLSGQAFIGSAYINGVGGVRSILTSVAASTDKTWTLPNATDTAVGLATSDVLTNKTLTAPIINGATSASGNFDLSGSSGTFKTTTGAATIGASSTTLSAAPIILASGAKAALATMTWTAFSLNSGWSDQGGYPASGWAKDAANHICFRGYVLGAGGGTSTTIATLPAGARPGGKSFFNSWDGTSTHNITVNTDGTIVAGTNNAGFLGAQICFFAEG